MSGSENTSELELVEMSRKEKICVGLTEKEIWDYAVTPTPCALSHLFAFYA